MSIRHIAWAFKQDIKTPGAKLVLVALAECADAETGETFAGQKHLAGMTSQGERTVRRHLDWLERKGSISRQERRRMNGSKTSDLITLNADLASGQNGRKYKRPIWPVSSGQNGHRSPAKLAGPYPSVEPSLSNLPYQGEGSQGVELGGGG